MMPRRRRTVALLLCIALAALLVLAVSLSDLQLEAGSPVAGAAGGSAASSPSGSGPAASPPGSVAVGEAILGVLLLVFLIYLPVRLSGLLNWRNLLRLALGGLLLILVLSLLPRIVPGLTVAPPQDEAPAAAAPSQEFAVTPLGSPPASFQWLAAAGLALGAAAVAALLLRGTARPVQASDALHLEAEKALEQLRSGADFQDVIVRCYLQMTDLLRAEKHMERHQSMTAHEFEQWLEAKGVPAEPVQRLTALFEAARYGSEPAGDEAEAAGADCLAQISRYCRAGSQAD